MPPHVFQKSLIQTVDNISKLLLITRVASATANFRFPSDYMVVHIERVRTQAMKLLVLVQQCLKMLNTIYREISVL